MLPAASSASTPRARVTSGSSNVPIKRRPLLESPVRLQLWGAGRRGQVTSGGRPLCVVTVPSAPTAPPAVAPLAVASLGVPALVVSAAVLPAAAGSGADAPP